MSGVNEIYQAMIQGFDLTPTPEDPTVAYTWEAHTQVVHMVGVRLLEEQFGGGFTSAPDEVRLHLERHERVARTVEGMDIGVPPAVGRAIRTMGLYLEGTSLVEELTQFLDLNSGIADRFGQYFSKHLGRAALPVKYSLSVVAKSAALMSECVGHELAIVNYKGL